jgi:hypothetical protein
MGHLSDTVPRDGAMKEGDYLCHPYSVTREIACVSAERHVGEMGVPDRM